MLKITNKRNTFRQLKMILKRLVILKENKNNSDNKLKEKEDFLELLYKIYKKEKEEF